MRKRILLLILVAIFGATTVSYGASYSDVTKYYWAHESIQTMSDKGIVKGYPDGKFKPSNNVTYGEFIKMALVSATGQDVGNAPGKNWAEMYYNDALKRGYYSSHDIGSHQMNSYITRAHMALITSSILGEMKIANYDEIQKKITDITYKTEYEYEITKAYAAGILTGYPDDTFRPERTLSRSEAVAVIHRLVDESRRVVPSVGVKPVDEPQPIGNFIKNYNSFYQNDIFDDALAKDGKTYSIDNDYAKYKMTLHENRGTTWIKIGAYQDTLYRGYFVKDNMIVRMAPISMDGDGNRTIAYKGDELDYIDYIGSLKSSTGHMTLIKNPFKK